jgi:hypothetical protein
MVERSGRRPQTVAPAGPCSAASVSAASRKSESANAG